MNAHGGVHANTVVIGHFALDVGVIEGLEYEIRAKVSSVKSDNVLDD
jgi:hypothetical protein